MLSSGKCCKHVDCVCVCVQRCSRGSHCLLRHQKQLSATSCSKHWAHPQRLYFRGSPTCRSGRFVHISVWSRISPPPVITNPSSRLYVPCLFRVFCFSVDMRLSVCTRILCYYLHSLHDSLLSDICSPRAFICHVQRSLALT